MKKLVFMAIIALAVTGSLMAQNWGSGPGWQNRGGVSQNVTITGTLQLRNGSITVENGNNVYYVPSLERFIGFIDGLKEGATVNIEGYTYNNPQYVEPVKLTIAGKNYDFSNNNPQNAWGGNGRGYQAGNGRGWCCW